MPDSDRGTDSAGRRAKRFLTPTQKYEVFLQQVRQEMTMNEAADHWRVDRGVIMRIRTVAKGGRSRPCRTRDRASMEPPRNAYSTSSIQPPMLVGTLPGRVANWSFPKDGRIAGWVGVHEAGWSTGPPAGAHCTACSMTRWPRP
jgi:hypothetical protein